MKARASTGGALMAATMADANQGGGGGSLDAIKERARMADSLIADLDAYVAVYGLPQVVDALVDVCNKRTGPVDAHSLPASADGRAWQACALVLDNITPELRISLETPRNESWVDREAKKARRALKQSKKK